MEGFMNGVPLRKPRQAWRQAGLSQYSGELIINRTGAYIMDDNNKIVCNQQEITVTDGAEDIRRMLHFLFSVGEVFEICFISPENGRSQYWKGFAGGKKAIIAGWFDDVDVVASLIQNMDKLRPKAVYCTLNPVVPALLARAENRLVAGVARTQDKEIAEVRHMLIDADPRRPAGISSTDQEKEAAIELIRGIYRDLRSQGWAEPLVGDSGNGGHLIYPLEQGCGHLVPETLKVLDRKYSTDMVSVDTTVGNPARLVKLYGTWTRKGDSTKDRPHRIAKILRIPEVA